MNRCVVSWSLLALMLVVQSAHANVPVQERTALLALYAATNGDSWNRQDGWSGPPGSECGWYGVTCDSEGTTVVELSLQGNNMIGTIPGEIEGLTNLTEFDLSFNYLNGSIPLELGSLHELRRLRLIETFVSGTIPPELGDLRKLQSLEIDSHNLHGVIPPELGQLSNLERLTLGRGLYGLIPPELANLQNLSCLSIMFNNLHGPIPGWLANLPKLTSLSLRQNNLAGPIPAGLGNLPNLQYLDLSRNNISQPIPPSLGGLRSLSYLNLAQNAILGPIPPSLGNLLNLEFMMLGDNRIDHEIPPELGNLAKLVQLSLQRNQLSGTIPATFGGLQHLTFLDLRQNQLTGAVPPSLGNLTELLSIFLDGNELSGALPAELGNLAKLETLRCALNHLSGPLPAGLGNLPALSTLDLHANRIVGEVPDTFLLLPARTSINLCWNGLRTGNPALAQLLEEKSGHPGFAASQTVPPPALSASPSSSTSATVTWQPVPLAAGVSGYYEVLEAATPGGPYTIAGITSDTMVSSLELENLEPGKTHHFAVRTVTNPHYRNPNTIVSAPSTEVAILLPKTLSFVTTALPRGTLGRRYRFQLRATGGIPPASFTVVNGSLPAGLELDGSTGWITGVPQRTGDDALVFRCTDSVEETAVAEFELRVGEPTIPLLGRPQQLGLILMVALLGVAILHRRSFHHGGEGPGIRSATLSR